VTDHSLQPLASARFAAASVPGQLTDSYFAFFPQRVRDAYAEVAAAFAGAGIFYAVKANARLEVLEVLDEAGVDLSWRLSGSYDWSRRLKCRPTA
jgi:diaminopimelate decarboxylase